MKDEPKWKDPKIGPYAKQPAGEGFGEDPINLGDDNCSPTPSHATEKRTMGRDSAKAAKKKSKFYSGFIIIVGVCFLDERVVIAKYLNFSRRSCAKNDRFQQLACIDEKRFEEMQSHNDSLLSIEQEKIRIMREKHDMEKQEKEKQEDERILAIDLDACTPAQRVYYQALQEESFEKIVARRGQRQGP
ncbi:hypothetical protein PR202_gb05717 [Eleusine coracana subsp. coracana]|uniref:No apical meristem-associated C-terminal domain-containing protein n=1 Tax=Eleusine coracana subsp. coracana TaxID=191504 RepID=A0AAV5E7F3_ELECO|nr:hypothetical protein PR202_gb05717 [Eleusine coracana subsp. coracana]